MVQIKEQCPNCNIPLGYEYKSYFSDDGENIIMEFRRFCPKCNYEFCDKSMTTSFPKLFENIQIQYNDNIPSACRNCSNHPSNGGSGICNCTLGNKIIY